MFGISLFDFRGLSFLVWGLQLVQRFREVQTLSPKPKTLTFLGEAPDSGRMLPWIYRQHRHRTTKSDSKKP